MAPTVLVVDDDDDVRSLVALQLTISGYEAIEAATVSEGLAVVQTAPPDLVLTDLNFGTETAERLVARCLADGQPVILMTASVETRDLPAGIHDGVRLLRKPFTLDDLARAVTEEIEG